MSDSFDIATEGLLQSSDGQCLKTVVRTENAVQVAQSTQTVTVAREAGGSVVAAGVSAHVTVQPSSPHVVSTERVDAQTRLSIVNIGLPGADGQDGADGAPGADGADGADGVDGIDGEGDKNYRHVQTLPLAIWTIVHSLNKYPAVNIVDSGGTEVVGDVVYISPSTITVSFISAFAGEAFCN